MTFDPNGGTLADTDKTRSLMTGDTYGTLPVPSYAGYDFAGWYTEKTGGTKIEENTIVTVTGTQTLYAHWTPIHVHAYTQQLQKPEALKTSADCINDAVYYLSCECGDISKTDTFTAENTALDHEWGAWMSNGNFTHTRTCSRDVSHTETENCSFSEATCIAKAVCKVCKGEYGETNPDNHAGTLGGWQSDENEHWKEYSCCGARDAEDSHDWDDGKITKSATCTSVSTKTYTCNICHKKKTEQIPATGHNPAEEWTSDATHHWHECANGCNEKVDYTEHTGGTATCTEKAVCTICSKEYGEKLAHRFTAEVAKSKYLKSAASCTEKAVYYKSCLFCYQSSEGTAEEATFETDALDHDWGEWTQNSDGKTHTRVCKRDASHKENGSCSGGTATCTEKAVCTICGMEYGEKLAHSFTAEVAESKYLKSVATCTEKAVYYKSCTACGEIAAETFEYGEPLDHDWDSWKQNDDGKSHTRVCKRDASHKENGSCSGGTATCTEKAVCTICGEEHGEIDPDTHAEDCKPEWISTETEHEQKYSRCGKEIVAKALHRFGSWTTTLEPTSSKTGERERLCEDCQYKEVQTIPTTGGSGGYSSYTIKATAGAGGSISPSGNVSVRSGRNQTFTITPDAGYRISDVKIDGKSIGAVSIYTFENVKKSHTIEVSFAKSSPFVDVPDDSYYEDAVDWAIKNGVTTGTDGTHFTPDGICTRAQAVTFLWRAAGSPAPKSGAMPFADVPASSYYYKAVLWAVESGVTKGTSATLFSPEENCTRGQIVTFLWRSEKSPAANGDNPFADVAADAYYAKAVLWAVSAGITKGTSSTAFSPEESCTRAQIVTFLWRCNQ